MSRYFDDTSIATVTCKRCGEAGHTTSSCKKDYLAVSKCLLCAQTGHLVSDCPQKVKDNNYRGRTGRHSLNFDDIDNEDGAKCMACGSFDHVNCTFEVDPKLLPEDSCPKCGSIGHNEKSCPKKPAANNRGPRHSWAGGGSFEREPFFEQHRKRHSVGRHTPASQKKDYYGSYQGSSQRPKKRAYGSTGSSGYAKRQRMWT